MLPEQQYGARLLCSPFAGKTIGMTSEFRENPMKVSQVSCIIKKFIHLPQAWVDSSHAIPMLYRLFVIYSRPFTRILKSELLPKLSF